jgi:hypothetical protein
MSCDSNKDQVKKERTNRISSYDRLIELNMIYHILWLGVGSFTLST